MGRIPVELKDQRDKLITKVLAERNGHNLSEIARKLSGHPLFSGSKNYKVIYQYILRLAYQNEATGEGQRSSLKSTPNTPSQSRFEQVVNRVSLHLPVGTADQIARLLRVLRAEFSLLEQEALKAKQLELEVCNLKSHRCMDVDTTLREENERLKERIAFLERRVEALSRLTTPKIDNDKHLAIAGR
ncbi:MAG: hypothetical protein HYW79_03180 [Parcubacteria group bacterium]|nr:hypothetical protein [Parcubacteria group bacterium]